MHFADFDQPFAAQMLADVLAAADVRQRVRKPRTAEHGAGRRLQGALRAFQHHHVIALAAGFVNPRHHGDQEQAADRGGVVGELGAEPGRQPDAGALLAVPLQAFEIVAHRMIGIFDGAGANRVAHDAAADMFQPGLLQILADINHVLVDDRARFERRHRTADRVHQHRRALHFVEGEASCSPLSRRSASNALAMIGNGFPVVPLMASFCHLPRRAFPCRDR